jgi:hypothetical protein
VEFDPVEELGKRNEPPGALAAEQQQLGDILERCPEQMFADEGPQAFQARGEPVNP